MKSATQIANRKAAWRWGGMIVGLLSLQVAGGIFAIMLATGDESVAVVPDYHQKALQWDQEVALQQASKQLGWVCDIRQLDSSENHPGVRILLTDRQGRTFELAGGELQIYQHTRAADVRTIPIPSGASSLIELDDCFPHDGLWQASLNVTDRNGNQFVMTEQIRVRASGHHNDAE